MGAGNGNSLIALNMDDDGFTESMVISNPTYSTYSNFYAIQEAGILESWKKPIIMISLKFDFQLGRGGGRVAGPQCRIMPLRGPTCKIARFQAGLKFPSWTECGNIKTPPQQLKVLDYVPKTYYKVSPPDFVNMNHRGWGLMF